MVTLATGGPAIAAQLNWPQAVAVDTAGNIYIVDTDNAVVRKVTVATGGVISTVAGTPLTLGYTGDGGLATLATLNVPVKVKLDSFGNIYIADQGYNVVRKVTVATGIITTVAGVGAGGAPYGDGGPATTAQVNTPWDLLWMLRTICTFQMKLVRVSLQAFERSTQRPASSQRLRGKAGSITRLLQTARTPHRLMSCWTERASPRLGHR